MGSSQLLMFYMPAVSASPSFQVSLLASVLNWTGWGQRSQQRSTRRLLEPQSLPASKCSPQCFEHGNPRGNWVCQVSSMQLQPLPSSLFFVLQVSAMRSLGCACAQGTGWAATVNRRLLT